MVSHKYLLDWAKKMPPGWFMAFGEDLVNELYEEIKTNNLDDYKVLEVGERNGYLRWYDSGGTYRTDTILLKYELVADKTCDRCGRPAKGVTNDFEPRCENCA